MDSIILDHEGSLNNLFKNLIDIVVNGGSSQVFLGVM